MYDFPGKPADVTDLIQVAQYLAVNQDSVFPRDELIQYLGRELLQRYDSDLPASLRDATPMELFAAVGQRRRAVDPADPYRVLADLPLSIYITTDTSNLLVEALRAAGKEP